MTRERTADKGKGQVYRERGKTYYDASSEGGTRSGFARPQSRDRWIVGSGLDAGEGIRTEVRRVGNRYRCRECVDETQGDRRVRECVVKTQAGSGMRPEGSGCVDEMQAGSGRGQRVRSALMRREEDRVRDERVRDWQGGAREWF
jgi:hypothetical protein